MTKGEVAMYELLVLALLMHWPLHAYMIAEIANHILGPWERTSRGTLSSLLTKLEQAGLIAPADPAQVPFSTDCPSRVFALTAAGRERFYQLMIDTTSNEGTYQRLFRIKTLNLDYVSLEDQLSLVACRELPTLWMVLDVVNADVWLSWINGKYGAHLMNRQDFVKVNLGTYDVSSELS